MKTDKNVSRSLLKIVETMGLIVVPLLMVLMAGVLLRSLMTEPVAQAKSEPPFQVENNPASSNAGLPIVVAPNLAIEKGIPASDIPTESFQSITANGITFYAGNYRLEMGQLLADVCFDMLDESDWMVWGDTPVVDEQRREVPRPSSISVIEVRYPPKMIDGKLKQFVLMSEGDKYKDAEPNKKTGQRCDTLGYILPESFDTSSFTITINAIASYPEESETCSKNETAYSKKMQDALDKKKTGIKIKNKWEQTGGGGTCGLEITQKPKDMSEAAARAILSDPDMFIDLFGIRGPWVFTGSIK